MTLARKANHIVHFQPRPALVVDCVHRATVGNVWQLKSLTYHNHNVALFRFGTRAHGEIRFARASSARDSAVSFLVRQSVAFAFGGFVSCVHHQGRSTRSPAKPPVRKVGRPTDLSATHFPTSASSSFGRKTRRLISLRPLRNSAASPARSEPRNDISAATAIGRATRRPQSSPKSSSERACATRA